MKRWQDRGEVEDSDEEEIAFSNESQSSERARKRPRTEPEDHTEPTVGTRSNDAGGAGSVGHEAHDDADEPWLQPKLTTTYARKAHRPERPGAVQREEPVGTQTSRVEAVCVVIPFGHGTQQEDGAANAPSDSPPASDDELPNVSQVIGRKTKRPQTPVDQVLSIASVHSSPLSELNGSPLPPDIFHFGDEGKAGASDCGSPPQPHQSDCDEDAAIVAQIQDADRVAAPTGGRTLRIRKEKQLHPYAWEMTLYQQQLIQRGLKPVRFATANRRAPETQDRSYSGDESESQGPLVESSRSPARPSSELGGDVPVSERASAKAKAVVPRQASHTASSDDEFPDIDAILGRNLEGVTYDGRKRRKVTHVQGGDRSNKVAASVSAAGCTPTNADEYSIPPSPPPTSSGSARQHEPQIAAACFRTLPSGFRLPIGTTPAPLPTPKVSSDARPSHAVGNTTRSHSDSSAVRSRISTLGRAQPQPVAIDSSTESEVEAAVDPLSEPEIADKRLKRVQKRIRGVLPASWLKIDFQARQRRASPSPSRQRRLSTASPPPTTRLEKGVAQRVVRTASTPSHNFLNLVSDDEDQSDNEQQTVDRSSPLRLDLGLRRLHFSGDADDDRMEADWVDPMLAGASRALRAVSKGKKRQPRITDAFHNPGSRGDADFSEERIRLQHRSGTSKRERREAPREKDRAPLTRRTRPSAPRLSVFDAPTYSESPGSATPLFMRVAQRQVRKRADHGRHSPSRKVIRLATKEDTDEANAVLAAWREGTIIPRASPDESSIGLGAAAPSLANAAEDDNDVEFRPGAARLRHPLAEITNSQQQRLPSPLQKERGTEQTRRDPHPERRRPQIRQTQLHPIVVRRNADAGETSTPDPPVQAVTDARTDAPGQQRRGRQVLHQGVRYRGAQLESLEDAYDTEHRAAAFERRINRLTETIARPIQGGLSRPLQLDRYLDDPQDVGTAKRSLNRHLGRVLQHGVKGQEQGQAQSFVVARRSRKRPPHHIDTEARQYRQPSEPLPDFSIEGQLSRTLTDTAGPALHGLGPFGTRYPTDFDIQPLPLGTYFHQSTFIGSGDFAACLKLADRDFASVTGAMRVHVAGDVLAWGAWSQEVATGLDRIPNAILDALQTLSEPAVDTPHDEQLAIVSANVDHMLRSIARYCSKCLAFSDPIDRHLCVQHLQRLVENLLEVNFDLQPESKVYRRLQTRSWQYALVIATQTSLLSSHKLIEAGAKQRSVTLATRAAQIFARHLLPQAFEELRLFYDDNQHSAKREAGIRDDDTPVSGIVILNHCVRTLNVPQAQLWPLLEEAWQPDTSNLDNVLALDKAWYDLFTMLPMMEMDAAGIGRPGSRLYDPTHDWSLPKALTARVLQLYSATSIARGASLKDYVRATLTRSFWLISRWGWSKCEAILGTVFDFYARRSLAQLDREESRGSPRYLDHLESSPSFEVQPEDRSFTIFLKMLAVGSLNMQKYSGYSDKKIGGIAWRFIPNHGRIYPKDADVKQSDMDALRNHHDLLCTLYYSSPPGHRLRVELVQNLVDHTSSHREACRLSVRAWVSIASFETSTSDPPDALQPLIAWFRELLQTTMMQFRLAKTEAEHDFAVAKAQAHGVGGITDALLTSTIAANQRSIAATLVDALVGLKRALLATKDLSAAIALVEGCAFWKAFVPFDAAEKRLVPALNEAVELIKIALSVQRRLADTFESQGSSEESQDYGDSSALQDFAASDGAHTSATHRPTISEHLHEPVSQLISNVFGADVALEDPILEKIVDAWVLVAKENTRGGDRSWSNFIDAYSPDSWHQLRDTEQRRKFTPYFLARVVEAAGGEDSDVMTEAETSLLTSLVDRAAMLKYQHLLLATLLNNVSVESLMENLPFSRDRKNNFYIVSLRDLRERRLAVLSSMFSNMRDGLEKTMRTRPQMLQQSRRRYADMLHKLMQAMKSNYQELQGATNHEQSADPTSEGSFVSFVQQVISFLQQYTADICRVDPFFTDSAAFPLPATDPMYVVGRLRSYVPKLADGKIRKQLAVFIHNVSERAAVDGHQDYLLGQLRTAMDGVFEAGNLSAPTLRHVLLTTVFPVYVEAALSTACSWIFALPVLRHLNRLGHAVRSILVSFEEVHQGAEEIASRLRGTYEEAWEEAQSTSLAPVEAWSDTRVFAQKQLGEALEADWHAYDGNYFVRKGNTSREVVVKLSDEDEEQRSLLAAIQRFRGSFEAIMAGGRPRARRRAVAGSSSM
ncbi:hypothetical protein B0A55_00334 [Friedmanniomyces simplex]|uniref:Uncharacterized protein n=1 Tax=Friedmanniomyces simplex TaxID=329884 RepID=A0A4U0Y1Y3_9PEZI|nr:hypothetical protein B0A55_00334 [Friedmanniomyces simplex]